MLIWVSDFMTVSKSTLIQVLLNSKIIIHSGKIGLHMLAFLVEVLEKGMQQVQVPILNIIYCMLHYIDLSSTHAQPISTDLIRVIAKYLDVSTRFSFADECSMNKMRFLRFADRLLERCVKNSEIGRNKKLHSTSCTARITWWYIASLLWQFQ